MIARRAVQEPGLALAALILILISLWALVPGWFTSYDPNLVSTDHLLLSPRVGHAFGTDNLGRDVLARVIYGSALTLKAAFLAVGLALVVGGLAGSLAASIGGRTDGVIMRVVDSMMAVPALLLAMAIVMALGFGTIHVAIAIGIAEIGVVARVMRAEVMRIRTERYVDAAYATGMRQPEILVRHILPNAKGPVLALAMLQLGLSVLAIASLSFLGFGSPPPAPEWGSLISEGRGYLATAWWMATFPGLAVAVTVICVNRVARAFEAAGSSINISSAAGFWIRRSPRSPQAEPASSEI